MISIAAGGPARTATQRCTGLSQCGQDFIGIGLLKPDVLACGALRCRSEALKQSAASEGSDARTPRGKALLAHPHRDAVVMMGRVRTFRWRANWDRSPPATSGHLALHLRTVLGLICRCGMAKFSAVHFVPQVTIEHAWGLVFPGPSMQRCNPTIPRRELTTEAQLRNGFGMVKKASSEQRFPLSGTAVPLAAPFVLGRGCLVALHCIRRSAVCRALAAQHALHSRCLHVADGRLLRVVLLRHGKAAVPKARCDRLRQRS
jgi:hypothetical protein